MRRLIPLLIVLVAAVLGAVRASTMRSVPGDFLRYHRAGRLVATGRAERLYDAAYLKGQHVYAAERAESGEELREHEWKYAPATAVLMAPLGVLHPRTANVVWGAWNVALIAAMFVALWRWCAGGLSAWWMAVPLAVLMRLVVRNVNLGQLNPSAIVPATLGAVWLARGRDKAAGAAIAFGTVVKFIPGLLAVWLAVTRRWKALAAFGVTVVVVGLALPAAVLGPSRAYDLHAEWYRVRSHHYTSASSPDVPGHSVKSFVYRVLGGVPFITGDGDDEVRVDAGVASLDPRSLQAITLAAGIILLAAAVWYARRPRAAGDPRGPPETGVVFAVLLLVSPEAREPHFLYLALPLVALTYAFVRHRGPAARRNVALALSIGAALLVNSTSGRVLGADLAHRLEAWCVLGWATVAFGAAILILGREAGERQPELH